MMPMPAAGSSTLCWCGPAIGWPGASATSWKSLMNSITWASSSFPFREQLDTGGPLGRAVVVIIGAIAELERSLIVERVRAGMRRARLDGTRLGRPPLHIDREALARDRARGYSFGKLARMHSISRTSVIRALQQSQQGGAV